MSDGRKLQSIYRGQLRRCEMCDEESYVGGMVGVGALDVCERCGQGACERALRRWNLRLEHFGDEDLRIFWPRQRAIHATFATERFGHKVRKLFGAVDQEVGDAAFDADIWVEHDGRKLTTMLLKEPAVLRGIANVLTEADSVALVEDAAITQAPSMSNASVLSSVALAIAVEKLLRSWPDTFPWSANALLCPDNVPLGRKTCRRCGKVSFERVASCPRCSARNWWN